MENTKNYSIDKIDIKVLNNIVKNNILVTTTSLKDVLLKESFYQKEILEFKLFSIQDFNNFINNTIDTKYEYLIYKELKNYNKSKQIFNNIPKVLPYLNKLKAKVQDSSVSDIEQLDEIENVKIKEILNFIENFEENHSFQPYIFGLEQSIYVLNVNLNYLLEDYKKISIVNNVDKKSIEVNKFKNIEDEIFFTFNEIANLINEGIDINDIEIYANSQYNNKIQSISNFYNITIDIESYYKLKKKDQQEIIKAIKNKSIEEIDINKVYKNKVFQFLNTNLMYLEDPEFIEFASSKLREIKITDKKLKNVLKVKSIVDFSFDSNKYNFILGFNNKDFLDYKIDNDYFEDSLKKQLLLETTIEYNLNMENKVIEIIKFLIINSKKNKISYTENISSEKVLVNNLINEEHFKVNSMSFLNNNVRNSKSGDIYNFKKYLYKSQKENTIYEEFSVLNDKLTPEEKDNISFDFRGNIKWDVNAFKENKNLSSTLIEKYYKCNFLFYLENILTLYSNPSNHLIIDIGIYIHNILEKTITPKSEELYVFNNEINIRKIEDDIQKISLETLENSKLFKDLDKSKKNLLILKINDYLKNLIVNILEQISHESFKVFASEEVINMDMVGYNFVGKIDSLLKHNDNYMVIDYKSGSTTIDLSDDLLNLGNNLQNIIYFILLDFKYDNVKFAGSYKYKVTPSFKDGYKNEENIPLRDGYTNVESNDILCNIDVDNYASLKRTKDGFSKASKILTEEEFIAKKEIVLNVINKFIIDLNEKLKYAVNPLNINSKDSCEYCSYFHICYKGKSSYRWYKSK